MNILEKNLLVLASAGSGKTYMLSDRIIGLMAKKGVDADQIVALTFTRKAAAEFTDAILRKLAEATKSPKKANELKASFGISEVDFEEILLKTIEKLPRLTLATMDVFFAKIVRGFQYELGLTCGRFELLEGEESDDLKGEILEQILDSGLREWNADQFIEIFLQARKKEEDIKVIDELQGFVSSWHEYFVSDEKRKWGPADLVAVDFSEWEKQKADLIAKIRRDWLSVKQTHSKQQEAFERLITLFETHSVGSGVLDEKNTLLQSIINAMRKKGTSLEVFLYKPFSITGIAAESLRKLLHLAAACEFAAALSRTRNIHKMIGAYDAVVDQSLRKKGKLGFLDVKKLMGAWMNSEEARLRREAVDFRLDAKYQHWLLDEFQDTSRVEWNALLPLIDEGLTNEDSTVFVVGDKKQSIYAWRGGEVGLFRELSENYGRGLKCETMADSWRSCPEVLEPVNRVFGDLETMKTLFGKASEAWEWQTHQSALPLQKSDYRGYAKIEIIEQDETMDRLVSLLKEIGIGVKKLTCGVLVDTNEDVKIYVDRLREEGFQVVEEGVRELGKDHPVGVLIVQILRWLANPADSFARRTLEMSPLYAPLRERFCNSWEDIWLGLSERVCELGFAGMIAEQFLSIKTEWGEFARRRLELIHEALLELDQKKVVSAQKAAEWIYRLKVSQSPGVAAIQVMTVHKSKGLGFDVVILPAISNDKIPNLRHFEKVLGEQWLSAKPAAWARSLIPELRDAEERWCEQQVYEAFCKLYVAMTRAKRGLYLFLISSKDEQKRKASYVSWLMNSLDLDSEKTIYEVGNAFWTESVQKMEALRPAPAFVLGRPIPKRARKSPSQSGYESLVSVESHPQARHFGIAWHAALETFSWLDDGSSLEFPTEFSASMTQLFSVQEIRDLFTRKHHNIQLRREQRVEAILENKWVSGVIDRLHIHQSDAVAAWRVELIDFKTDRVKTSEELKTRYSSQIVLYRKAIQAIFPQAEIQCYFVSTSLAALIRVF